MDHAKYIAEHFGYDAVVVRAQTLQPLYQALDRGHPLIVCYDADKYV